MIDDRCTTAHVDSHITFAARLLPAVDDSWLLIVVASDSLDHIIAFINFKIFLNFILSNSKMVLHF